MSSPSSCVYGKNPTYLWKEPPILMSITKRTSVLMRRDLVNMGTYERAEFFQECTKSLVHYHLGRGATTSTMTFANHIRWSLFQKSWIFYCSVEELQLCSSNTKKTSKMEAILFFVHLFICFWMGNILCYTLLHLNVYWAM